MTAPRLRQPFRSMGFVSVIIHHRSANIMAQYLDNNEDGVVDNALLLSALTSNDAALYMWKPESQQGSTHAQDLGADESVPAWHTNGKTGRFYPGSHPTATPSSCSLRFSFSSGWFASYRSFAPGPPPRAGSGHVVIVGSIL